jgi:hypothetical protein
MHIVYSLLEYQNFKAYLLIRMLVCLIPLLTRDSTIQELRFPSVSRGCMSIVLRYIYTNHLPAVRDAEVGQLAHEWGLHHLYSHSMVNVFFIIIWLY